jgi:glutathione S-transferase
MLKIHGRANSINVRKVLWVADEIGLTYTREDWGRGYRPTTDPAFSKLNPFQVIPVIDDDGFILRESNAIVRYLAQKHGRTDLYPTGLKERAQVESWMDWGSTDFHENARPVFLGLVVKSPAYSDRLVTEAAIAGWTHQMRLFDGYLAERGPFVAGDHFTIADIPVGLAVNRWFGISFTKPEYKAVSAYYDRLAERPAYRTHGRNGTP